LISDNNSRCRSSCRDKIEFQFAVPNYARTTPAGVGARFRRIEKINLQDRTSNRNKQNFVQFFNKVAVGTEEMLITAAATLRRSLLHARGEQTAQKLAKIDILIKQALLSNIGRTASPNSWPNSS